MAVTITPGGNIQATINANPPGTEYIFAAGIHRLSSSFTPKSGDTLRGEEGAVLNGARVLTGWVQDGVRWYISGQPTPIIAPASIQGIAVTTPEGPRANWLIDLFVENVPFAHVDDLSNLGVGTWFFDDQTGRVYIGENPANFDLIELSQAPYALLGDITSGVTVRDLVVEKFANRHQEGALHLTNTTNYTVENVTCRLNHGLGIKYGDGAHIHRCTLVDNGQLGLGGLGDNAVIENCEIARNNFARYNSDFEAGGTKFSQMNGSTIRNNYIHSNLGKGLWLDIDNGFYAANVIERNICYNNESVGLYLELSWDCIVRDNWSGYNAVNDWDGGLYGAQIYIANSSDVDAYNNTVVIPAGGGNGITIRQSDRGFSPNNGLEWLCNNNEFRDNRVVHLGTVNHRNGGRAFYKETQFHLAGNNRFRGNDYYVQSASSLLWKWQAVDHNFTTWQNSFGQDVGGTITAVAEWPAGLADVPVWLPDGSSGGQSPTPPTPSLTYREKVRTIPDVLRLYPIAEPGGTVMVDDSPNAQNGVYSDVALAQAGIGTGETAGVWTAGGSASHASFYSADFNTNFNRNEFTVAFWVKVPAAVWSDGQRTHFIRIGDLSSAGEFLLYIRKETTNNAVAFYVNVGGGNRFYQHTNFNPTTWVHMAAVRSLSENATRYYINGAQVYSSTATGSGTSDGLDNKALLGADSTSFTGTGAAYAYLAIYNRALTPAEILSLYQFNEAPVVVTPPDQVHVSGISVLLPIVAVDNNPSDTLTYSASGLPEGLTINPTTGVISGTLGEAGSTAVTVSVTDDGNPNLTTTVTFNWVVLADTGSGSTLLLLLRRHRQRRKAA
ncbi:MAG: hypothetical protein OHK0046_32160 [Anaerolineae bacterium]